MPWALALLLLVSPAWAVTRCTTDEEKTMGHSSGWWGEYRYVLRCPEDFEAEA
jgi:hypothetical protein